MTENPPDPAARFADGFLLACGRLGLSAGDTLAAARELRAAAADPAVKTAFWPLLLGGLTATGLTNAVKDVAGAGYHAVRDAAVPAGVALAVAPAVAGAGLGVAAGKVRNAVDAAQMPGDPAEAIKRDELADEYERLTDDIRRRNARLMAAQKARGRGRPVLQPERY